MCTVTDDVVTRSKNYLDSGVIVEMCQFPNGVLTTHDPGFRTPTGTSGCFNNSAYETSHGSVNSEDKRGPGMSVKPLPEAGSSNSVACSTPDSVMSANICRSQPTSYLEMFNARRRLGQNVKRQIALRKQQISTLKNQVDVSVRPRGTWIGTGIEHSTDNTKHARQGPGYANMLQHEMKERVTGCLRRSPAESPHGQNSWLSKLTNSSPSKDPCGFSYSEQCVEKHVKHNKKHPPANLAPSISSNRNRWTPSSRLEEDVVPPTISHFNQSNVHPVYGHETGSTSRDWQMNGSNIVNKHRFIKGSKRKHETSSPFYPDPELVRIYGGSKTTSSMRKSTRKVLNINHDSCQGRKTNGGCRISDKSYQNGTTDDARTDAGEMPGTQSQISRDLETFSDRRTPVLIQNEDASGSININVKGIMKSQNGNGRRSESLSADSSCTENGATRRVRFQCPEQDLMLARNAHPRIRQSRVIECFEDDDYNSIDVGTKYERYRESDTNIKLQDQDRMSLSQSNKMKKEHYFISQGSGIVSPLYLRKVATLERNLPIIQHFRDVGDYDDLYPGNGKATRWNEIGLGLETLETRALTLTSAENTSVNMADSDHSFVQMGGQNENHEEYTTSGCVTRQPYHGNASNYSPGRSSQKRARSVISNESNDESGDGRASGDGMRSSYCCCLWSDTPSVRGRDHSAPMSHDFLNTSLETSKRKQTAVENLERALKHGVMHAGSVNDQIGYTVVSPLRQSRNVSSEGHVDVIDTKALEERVKALQQQAPLPPCVRYRNQYDNSSKNNCSVWCVGQEHGIPTP